jgi:hypothetical protein
VWLGGNRPRLTFDGLFSRRRWQGVWALLVVLLRAHQRVSPCRSIAYLVRIALGNQLGSAGWRRRCLKMARDSIAIPQFSERISYLKRVYAKGLGHKPSTLQAAAIHRAAALAVRLEAALLDPDITANDLVRLDGAARRARLDMQAVLAPSKREPALSLAELGLE